MSTLISESNLKNASIGFDQMINQFGVVTVMNAKLFGTPLPELCNVQDMEAIAGLKAHDIVKKLKEAQPDAIIDTLKIANINIEGPSKTVTGGQYANPLIKFGKTATIEMQDALGRANVLEVLGGAVVEKYQTIGAGTITNSNQAVIHVTNDFAGPTTILGESFFIDQKTGTQVPVYIALYQVLPDSIFNLTQDSEGDATVFDLNGALLATTITIGTQNSQETDIKKGVFYSILPQVNYEESSKRYAVTYSGTSGSPASADELALITREAESYTDTKGQYLVPSISGFKFYKEAAASSELTGIQTFEQDTLIYVKKGA